MRILQGTVISNRMTKTVVVRVVRLVRHPLYRKYYRLSRAYKAHAEDAAAHQPGDVVRIAETRPRSKEKRWKVVEVIERAPTSAIEPAASEAGA